jgi:hypothetical protein
MRSALGIFLLAAAPAPADDPPPWVVPELFRDLYEPGLYPDLWFLWEGKPLILADPALLKEWEGNVRQDTPAALDPGRTLGQSFTVEKAFGSVGGCFPTWKAAGSAMTLSLHRNGPGGERLSMKRFEKVEDNAWLSLELKPRPAVLDFK